MKVNSFWMKKVVGIKLVVKGEPGTHANPVVICNHQSWFDIPIIQDVITGTGPMVKFLIKRELVWVPIIGWICQVMGFPKLGRSKRSDTRKDDIAAVQTISMGHEDEAGALLIFPEGTRFSEEKKTRQQSPYQHLLKPRSGGLKIIKHHVSQATTLVDQTIDYHKTGVRIWECLHGDPGLITVTIAHYELAEINDLDAWLNNRWAEKDRGFTVRK
ncbi:MAG: 1-acyl-sn-glycerol-3-phosphate acyltransferase [Pseudomonadales bacterium]